MIQHGDRAAGNRRLAEAVDRRPHKNICQAKHRTLYRRGQAGFVAEYGARRKFPTCWVYIMFTPGYPIHDLGGFRDLAMVEKGMGISILPDLILKRVPYKIELRPLEEPYYRSIGLAMKNRKT